MKTIPYLKILIVCLVCITLSLAGAIFYLTNKNPDHTTTLSPFGDVDLAPLPNATVTIPKQNQNSDTSKNTTQNMNRDQLQDNRRPLINLGSSNMPLAYYFELPIGYKAYLVEGQEGGYGARITILKEELEHIYKSAGIELWITGQSPYNEQGTEGDEVIERIIKNHGPSAIRTTFLGNKAVEVKGEMIDGSLQTIGYIKNTRVPNYPYVVVASYNPTYIGNTTLPVGEYRNILKTLQVIVK